MTDIALTWDIYDADFSITANDLTTDEGLETAILLSLFTDRRSDEDDAIPDGTDDRRGWWGDSFPAVADDLIGSRLWLLSREKQLQTVVTRAQEYAREALQWMLDDRVLDRIDVTAEIVRTGVLGILVVPYRPNKQTSQFRFDLNWMAQAAKAT
jgi:phage gp46-like protein